MENVSLEDQLALIRIVRGWQLRRMTPRQEKVLLALENTINSLGVFRKHVERLDPQDEEAAERLAAELMQLLNVPAVLPGIAAVSGE